MSLVTRTTKAGMDASTGMYAPQLTGLIAGEALDVVAPCYIKSSDGLVYMSNATSANEAAEVVGFTPRAVAIGQPVTLFGIGARFRYGTGLTPGNVLYLGATAGRLDTAATTGDAFGYAVVITATDIVIIRGMPVLTSATVGAGTISVTELANDAVETAKIKDVNVTQAKLEVGAAGAGLTGLVTKFVADGNVIGGIPVIHHAVVAAGANGNTDITLTHKTRIVDIIVKPRTSVASAVCTVKNVTDTMSDAMVAAVAGVQTHAASIAVAYDTIAAGTVLRATFSGGATQPDADVYYIGYRVA
jgi:hypothetical protein